jgi:hypothetical protein
MNLKVNLKFAYGSLDVVLTAEKYFNSLFVPQIGSKVCIEDAEWQLHCLPTGGMRAEVSEVRWDTVTNLITVLTETQMYSDRDMEKRRLSHQEILEGKGWLCKFQN